VELNLEVNGRRWKRTFYIVPGLSTPIILGSDWMRDANVIIDVSKNIVTFRSCEVNEPLPCLVEDLKLKASRDICIPALHTAKVQVDCGSQINVEAVLSPSRSLQLEKQITQPYVYAELHDGKTEIWLNNLTTKEVVVRKNTTLCYANNVSDIGVHTLVGSITEANRSVNPEILMDLDFEINIGDSLTIEQKQKVISLVKEYSSVFANDETKMGKTNLVQHRIVTEEHSPIHLAPYRASFTERREIKRRVDELCETDIVSLFNSPWSAPVVLIPKRMAVRGSVWTTEN